MLKRAVGLGIAAMASGKSVISNDTKRDFYLNDEDVAPVPGTPTAPALAPSRNINGVSVRTSESTEGLFRSARKALECTIRNGKELINKGYTKYYTTEREVTSTVSELHSKREDLFPNALYIAIGALSGNIFARQRGYVSKILFPVVFGGAAFRYFLPQTFTNTTHFLWRLEEQKLPHIAENQKLVADKANAWAKSLEEGAIKRKKYVEDRADDLKKRFGEATGLNVDEEVSKR